MTTKTKSKPTTTKAPKGAGKKPKATKPAKQPDAAPKLSALDAAAKVLAEAKEALGCQDLIGRMAAAGHWTSPNGKTPAATLYAAITREIATKGEASRFKKAGRGRFALATLP